MLFWCWNTTKCPKKNTEDAYDIIYAALAREYVDATNNLYQLAFINEPLQQSICKQLAKQIADEHSSVMQMLDIEGRIPGQYLAIEETTLKKELLAAYAKLKRNKTSRMEK